MTTPITPGKYRTRERGTAIVEFVDERFAHGRRADGGIPGKRDTWMVSNGQWKITRLTAEHRWDLVERIGDL